MNFFTSDIDLFWSFYDNNNISNLTSIDVRNKYINKGTAGLQDYAIQKGLSNSLSNNLKIQAYQDYYESVRSNTKDFHFGVEKTKQAVSKLANFYPPIRYTDVYFLVGALTAGGRVSNNGLLIAVEMFSKTAATPTDGLNEWLQNVTRTKEFLPSIITHELIHFQQSFVPRSGDIPTALEQSIREGMADYISEYLLGNEPFVNEHLHEYGDLWESIIWQQFLQEKDLDFFDAEWLYTGEKISGGHPADTGYYIGYQIVEAFAAKFSSREDAIVAMLQAQDYVQLFEQSGYRGI